MVARPMSKQKRVKWDSMESINSLIKLGSFSAIVLLMALQASRTITGYVNMSREEMSELISRKPRQTGDMIRILMSLGYLTRLELGTYRLNDHVTITVKTVGGKECR